MVGIMLRLSTLGIHLNKRTMSTLVKPIQPTELHTLLQQQHTGHQDPFRRGFRIIDVREHHEIEETGHIDSAVNIPMKSELLDAALADLDPSIKTIVHCMSGRRSSNIATKLAENFGFKNVYNLEGGFKQWLADKLPVRPFANNHSPWVHLIFELETETAQYVVTDLYTKEAYIIDPVLDYDPFTATVHPTSARQLLEFVNKHDLNVTKIIDTHVHADHLTAALYLQRHLASKPQFWMGGHVTEVQKVFREKYNIDASLLKTTGEQFDHLVKDGETWTLGKDIQCSVLSTPGHTPACMSYLIGDAGFVGDTLFMPDIGTARCDFPGGSAETMYNSIQKMYKSWPDDTRIFVGHDYPPPAAEKRSYQVMTTLAAHKESNKMIKEGTPMEEYIKLRRERDAKLRSPRYLHPSLQTNLRGGHLPQAEKSPAGDAGRFFKIPVRFKE